MRPARPEDREAIWRVHTASIRGLASGHYRASEIEAWAAAATPEMYGIGTPDVELVVAESEAAILGFAALDLASATVLAVYVHPAAVRRSVGISLMRQLERRAITKGLLSLRLEASLNSVPFYTRAGFSNVRHTKHRLATGVEIACVEMEKRFTVPSRT